MGSGREKIICRTSFMNWNEFIRNSAQTLFPKTFFNHHTCDYEFSLVDWQNITQYQLKEGSWLPMRLTHFYAPSQISVRAHKMIVTAHRGCTEFAMRHRSLGGPTGSHPIDCVHLFPIQTSYLCFIFSFLWLTEHQLVHPKSSSFCFSANKNVGFPKSKSSCFFEK